MLTIRVLIKGSPKHIVFNALNISNINLDIFLRGYLIIFILILTVFTSFVLLHNHEVDANHLANKTSEQTLKFHKFRMEKLPSTFTKINIPASTNINKLNASSNKSNDIQKIINSSDLLSIMSYEKGKILLEFKF